MADLNSLITNSNPTLTIYAKKLDVETIDVQNLDVENLNVVNNLDVGGTITTNNIDVNVKTITHNLDVGNILNVNILNSTVVLNSNTLNVSNQLNLKGINIGKPPFLYASIPNTVYNVSGQVVPLIFNDIIGNEITGADFPKVKFNKSGIYKFSCDMPITASALTTYNTNLILRFQLYNASGALIKSSSTYGSNNLNAYFLNPQLISLLGSLSLNAIFDVNDGDYFEAEIRSSQITPPNFNLTAEGSLCITYISSL